MRALIRASLLTLAVYALPGAQAATDYPFATYAVQSVSLADRQVLDGTLEAVNSSTVSAQTSGTVTEINYDVDDFVEKGAVILKLRNNTQRAAVAQARAQLDSAQARYVEARDEQRRIADIYEKRLVAKSQLDSANAALNSARAAVKAAEAAVKSAEEELSRTVIRAPYAGIVTERFVEPGEAASPGVPLMSGISLENLRVTVNVPQRLIGGVRQAGSASVLLPDGSSIQSSDLTFFPYADSATNTFRVRIQLEEGAQGLFPGMLVKVAFDVDSHEALTVPATAVVYRSELTGVYVADDEGRVSLRQVRLGHETDGQVEVLSGLQAGEQVAADPVAAGIYIKEQGAKATHGAQ
ncbi:efflux RND transporter periplasmic adaptor subunit [Granulosicoccaceae sp. 1_MG-2023]|nr:efflux RND transporter periplasmic adaptor subunit [Granulosicoccaceae sp. 1_MG-2023]